MMTNQSLNGIGLAITRPLDQAKKLSALITQAGGCAISYPLIEIIALDNYSQFDLVVTEANNYDWAIFISSNAVQHGMARLIKHGLPAKLKFAAIGPVTAAELEAFGVKQVLTPKHRFDSEALLSLPDMQNMQGKKVMIVRGIGGRDVLSETLTSRGAQVTFAECYQRTNPQTDCNLLTKLYDEKKLHGVVVTSSEAMRYLLDLTADSNWLKQVILFVNHPRIAQYPLHLNLKVAIADAPGDLAMIELILKTIGQTP